MFGKNVLATTVVAASALTVSAFAAGKVACVGNSITYGYGIESWPDQTSYPHHLQGMLRENALSDTVENFGVSGLTVRKDDQASYWKGYRFAPAIEFAADTVIIELGTNDSKAYTTWNSPAQNAAVDSAITADFEALIDTFQVKSKPHVFICLAPYVNNVEWNILDTAVVNRVNPAILRAGLEKGVNVIDLHSRFSALENPGWYLSDLVHPSVEGAKHLAEIVYAHLQMDTLHVTQDGSTLKAPKGFGFQWYKDGRLLDGDTLETLTVSSVGKYKVSVKIDEKSLSRIVTETLDLQERTALKPNARVSEKASVNSSRYLEQRFDARGRALKTQSSFQKVYIKRL
ncbi:GDSL-type esterase/lipase family protein [Fibrobacter succinogenes]|uniref:GDSL-type esterase/lipase family protein n=1 Tax=Fibrobacter succinogenes TaxID=833 RepID=UPI0026F21198|nr:GDSL-type esterase/lipase family protein [Fibrobacter succinogenes]